MEFDAAGVPGQFWLTRVSPGATRRGALLLATGFVLALIPRVVTLFITPSRLPFASG